MVVVILNVIVIDTVIAEAIAEVADLARVKSCKMWVFEGGYYIYIYIHMWQRLKNIGLVIGLGGLFATRLVTESGGLATNPPCDKPFEDYSSDYSALHRRPRQGFVTGGPQQRFVTEGGTAINPYFEALLYIYIYIYIFIYLFIYMHIYIVPKQSCRMQSWGASYSRLYGNTSPRVASRMEWPMRLCVIASRHWRNAGVGTRVSGCHGKDIL